MQNVQTNYCSKLDFQHNWLMESIKTTSMETVGTGVLDKNKEHYLRSKDKAEKSSDVSGHMQLHKSKY